MHFPIWLASAGAGAGAIPLGLTLPFGLLLALIALMPLAPAPLKHFWERSYAYVAIGLGLAVAAYFLFLVPEGGAEVAHTLAEYFSFISLIGSLFVVAAPCFLRFSMWGCGVCAMSSCFL